MTSISTAGNKGDRVRSDCFVILEVTDKGGIDVQLNSTVQSLYGESIVELCIDELKFFGIGNARLKIEDRGALEFVLTARIEACVKQLIDTNKEYLPDLIEENKYRSSKERIRVSRLYIPGNSPKLMINAGIYAAHGIILDLEDAVSISRKDEARLLVRNALRQVDFYGAERMVRINQLPEGLDDLTYVVPHNTHLILIPKCESKNQILRVNKKIESIKKEKDNNSEIFLMPIIESALGVLKAYEIATAAENIVAMAIGLEDYTADLGTMRTCEGTESFYARSQLVNACCAAGIQPIDSVFSDVADMTRLRDVALNSKKLGFKGMGCIHPRQIKVVHDSYAPEKEEIDKAKKIVTAFHAATEKGLGVVSLGSKMIDAPVVKQAQQSINSAIGLGLLSNNWRNDNE